MENKVRTNDGLRSINRLKEKYVLTVGGVVRNKEYFDKKGSLRNIGQ